MVFMKKKYILALDEGTTSARAGLFDIEKNEFVQIKSKSFEIFYPKEAWVEFDANEIWEAQKEVLIKAKGKIGVDEIFGIGITNQRETAVAWDSKTGRAVKNAICWQCRRTADYCQKIALKHKRLIKDKTGLVIDPYFSASKFNWLLKNNEEVKELARQNRLCLGTIDSFLLYRLTGGKVFATDTTNASRTMLMNLRTLEWDDELLKIFGIKKTYLPKIMASSGEFGETNIFERPLKIFSMIGDQQSALVGQSCFEKGMAKNTYGTGCFMLVNTGSEIVENERLVSTVAYTIGDKTTYAVEGSVLNAGSLVEWLKAIGLIKSASQTEEMALREENNGGVYLVPAFTGLGAPYWEPNARGVFTGLTRGTTKNHLVRAVLESMAYSTYDIFNSLGDEKMLKELRVDGGVSNNNFLMQFQADLLNTKIKIPNIFERTLLGAVYLAGLASGAYQDLKEISSLWELKKSFEPTMTKKERSRLIKGWLEAVRKSI